MPNRRLPMPRRQHGISLIEIMVALVAGLIVVGSVLAFTVSSVKSNAENIRATRLAQELRTAITLVTREVRRAGYNLNAAQTVATEEFENDFSAMDVEADCIAFAYDDPVLDDGDPDTNVPVEFEMKGFRRVVTDGNGVLQFNGELADVDCDAGVEEEWIDVTNPADVDMTDLTFTDTVVDIETGTPGVDPSVSVRTIDIAMSMALETDPNTIRTSTERIRVRADTVTVPVPP